MKTMPGSKVRRFKGILLTLPILVLALALFPVPLHALSSEAKRLIEELREKLKAAEVSKLDTQKPEAEFVPGTIIPTPAHVKVKEPVKIVAEESETKPGKVMAEAPLFPLQKNTTDSGPKTLGDYLHMFLFLLVVLPARGE